MCTVLMMHLRIFFFFSSRRRHTRYWRDWSSDVCSSDLAADRRAVVAAAVAARPVLNEGGRVDVAELLDARGRVDVEDLERRSEERRVGKECRSRWSPYH